MLTFSTISAVIVICFILIFLFLCILRCRMKRAEHKEHDSYNLFFSRSAHRGSILVPVSDPPNIPSTVSKKSMGRSGDEKRRSSLQDISVERQNNSSNTRSSQMVRRGSAPVLLMTDSLNLYKGNELMDRYRLFRCNSATLISEDNTPGSSTCAADSSSGVHGVSKKNGSDKDAHRIFLQGVTIESQKWSSKTPFCQRETGRRGSAPGQQMTGSIDLLKDIELRNRHPLSQYRSTKLCHSKKSRGFKSRLSALTQLAHAQIPEHREPADELSISD